MNRILVHMNATEGGPNLHPGADLHWGAKLHMNTALV